MHVYGELIRAQFENRTTDHAVAVVGMAWWRTDLKQIRTSDGTSIFNILANNEKCILGSNATAANNIRFHRGANKVLQFVTADDATVEGTLSTSLGQLSFRAENYATGSLPANGNIGRIVYDTSAAKLKVDNGTGWDSIEAGLDTSVKNYALAENISIGDPVRVNAAGTLNKLVYSSATITGGATINAEYPTSQSICFDTVNNRVVSIFMDPDDLYGYAVVGELVNDTITWGTPVAFQSASTEAMACCFDEDSGKVVICYTTGTGAAQVGNCILGTVSGMTISFAAPVQFSPNEISAAGFVRNTFSCIYDPYYKRVVIAYSDLENASKGYALPGKITNGIISFDAATQFSPSTNAIGLVRMCIDTDHHRIIIVYSDTTNNGVGIVSATFTGALLTYPQATLIDTIYGVADEPNSLDCCYDPINKKFITAFNLQANGYKGMIIAGELFGTDDGAKIILPEAPTSLLFTNSDTRGIALSYDLKNERFILAFLSNVAAGEGVGEVIVGELVNGVPTLGASQTAAAVCDIESENSTSMVYAPNQDRSILLRLTSNGNEAFVIKTLTPKQCVGVLNETGTTGQTKPVCLIGAISSAFTGKIPSSHAYIQSDLSIGYKKTRYPIGQFVSATELLLGKGE